MAIGTNYTLCKKTSPDGTPLPSQQLVSIGVDSVGTDVVSTQNIPLARRQDNEATIATSNGDFAYLQLDDTGRLKVDIGSSITIDTVNTNNLVTVTNLDSDPVPVSGTFWQTTQPVSVETLPLPNGASTAGLQSTSNILLNSIDGNNKSKIFRIRGADDYTRIYTYFGNTQNPTTIVYTGTTAFGPETITETITYINPTAPTPDFRIAKIIYS